MSTYDHDVLTARFAALAPRPLPGDWGDVRERAGRVGRHRKLVFILAAAVLVAVVGTAAYGALRVAFLDKGFIGLPPVAATPSSPEEGALLVEVIARSSTLGNRLNLVWLYADGRMVWRREGAAPAGANEATSGFLERRLTPEGVERLRSELLATGLFDRDRRLLSAHSPWGTVRVRRGDAFVLVGWANPRFVGEFSRGHTAVTPQQLKALERIDALLADPASRLPANAWEDAGIKAYVASRYAICRVYRPDLPSNPGAGTIDASRILGLLPPPLPQTPGCAVVSTEEARTVARALDDAGLERRGGGKERGAGENLLRLAYRFDPPTMVPGSIFFEPVLPHGEWACSVCG
jgi:hypothetical protein